MVTKKMTRREALKNLGLLATGAFMLSSGSMLCACSEESGKKRIVFYFTGSGNSL